MGFGEVNKWANLFSCTSRTRVLVSCVLAGHSSATQTWMQPIFLFFLSLAAHLFSSRMLWLTGGECFARCVRPVQKSPDSVLARRYSRICQQQACSQDDGDERCSHEQPRVSGTFWCAFEQIINSTKVSENERYWPNSSA